MAANDTKAVARQIRPTESWAFAQALALLTSIPEDSVRDALDDFLLQNTAVLSSPLPFSKTKDSTLPTTEQKKDFSLRGVLYTNVSPAMSRAAHTLSSLLSVDYLEALRVIVQTNKRIPESSNAGNNTTDDVKLKELDTSKTQAAKGGQSGANTDVSPSNGIVSKIHSETKFETNLASENRLMIYAAALLRERRVVLEIASTCFNSRSVESATSIVRNLGKSYVVDSDFILGIVKALETSTFLLAQNSRSTGSSDLLHDLFHKELLLHMTRLLVFLYELLLSLPRIPTAFVKAWFTFMKDTSFTSTLGPHVLSKDFFSALRGLSTIITLQSFALDRLAAFKTSDFLEDPHLFVMVNEIVCSRNPSSVITYAWLIILYTKSVMLEALPDSNVDFLSVVSLDDTSSSVRVVQSCLRNVSVFSEIISLRKTLEFDDIFSIALADLITAAMPFVSVNHEIASCIGVVLSSAPDSCVEKFFENEAARNAIVLARTKFPIAIDPFLSLASINGNFALHELSELKTYMALYQESEFSQLFDIDSENTDLVKITSCIDMYPPYEPNKKLSFLFKPDTKAKIFPTADKDKIFVIFLYNYNGWAFMGRVLENMSKSFDNSNKELTTTLSTMLDLMIRTSSQETSNISLILEYMSAFTDDSDIVDVFFRLFEQSLHNRNVVLSEKLLQLFSNLMPVASSRFWPYLASTSLLPNNGKEGFSSILFGYIEMVKGDYNFTFALVKFVFSLAENCLTIDQTESEHLKSTVMAKFVQHLIQVFECINTCKFNNGFQKLELGVFILDVFRQILETIYSISSKVSPSEKPTKVFATAAANILEAFLFVDFEHSRSVALILELIDSLASPAVLYDARDVSGFLGDIWVHSAFSFAKLLVTIRSSINAAPSKFEKVLFSRIPQLVFTYAAGGSHRKVVLDLLTALTSGKWESEQMPSILSHLGRDNSRILLHSLATDLETRFDDNSIKISIYDFLCSILEANQQGLSVLFISGRDIFGQISGSKDYQESISLLSILKRNINDIKYYPPSVTIHLLDAISMAFNSWTTAKCDEGDVVFVNEMVKMLADYDKVPGTKTSNQLILSSYECNVNAKIAEILSLLLFTNKNEKCSDAIAKLLLSDSFIKRLPRFLSILDYECMLYEKTKDHFMATYSPYILSDFASSLKKRNRFGKSAVYDLLLLDSLFQKTPKWKEVREEVVHLSANMQYFNAQLSLSKSISALLTTFCRRTSNKVTTQYLELVNQLLTIVEPKDTYSEFFAPQHYYERIELAFLLLQTITSSQGDENYKAQMAVKILEACGDLMENPDVGYLITPTNESGYSYRSLLRIVYLALSCLKSDHSLINTHTHVLLKLFDFVVAKGTRSIIFHLQNDVYLSRTDKKHKSVGLGMKLDDLRLILSILKIFVELDGSRALQAELICSLERNDTASTLLSLYSFSHLILINNEPLFAQIGLMFIQQLLVVEEFVSKLMNSNLFTVIRESVISQPLRSGGVSIKDSPQIHRNWTNGILPILVTCLSHGGATDEVIDTLWAFSRQIEFCVGSWSNDSSSLRISSAGTLETMQLLYIYRLLSSMARIQGIVATSPTDVDMAVLPGLDTPQKRSDFVGFVNNMLKHPKFLASRIYPSSQEEEAMLKTEGPGYHAFVAGLIEDIGELREFVE